MLTHELPPGKWVFFGGLHRDVTEQELSDFFYDHGLEIPPEAISIRMYTLSSNAIVSVTENALVHLVNWLLNGDQLRGRRVEAQEVRRTKSA